MVYYRYMVYFGCYFEEKRIVKNCSGLWFQVISIFKYVSIGHITVLVLAGDTTLTLSWRLTRVQQSTINQHQAMNMVTSS